MQEEMVIYSGRAVPKKGFRVFIYAKDGSQRLVNSWDEYEEAIQSGAWFASKDKMNLVISDSYIEEKKKRPYRRKERLANDDD